MTRFVQSMTVRVFVILVLGILVPIAGTLHARSIDVAEPFARLDLDALLDSVCSDAHDAGHDVVLREETAAIVLGSVSALRRCFTNVIDNAVAYGGRADVSCVVDGGRAIVRVRDSGPGLSDQQLGSVFDPFYRVEASRSRATGGTGLGLTITQNIVVRHGGTVSLRNRVGGGLEVTVDLPLAGVEPAFRAMPAGSW